LQKYTKLKAIFALLHRCLTYPKSVSDYLIYFYTAIQTWLVRTKVRPYCPLWLEIWGLEIIHTLWDALLHKRRNWRNSQELHLLSTNSTKH